MIRKRLSVQRIYDLSRHLVYYWLLRGLASSLMREVYILTTARYHAQSLEYLKTGHTRGTEAKTSCSSVGSVKKCSNLRELLAVRIVKRV